MMLTPMELSRWTSEHSTYGEMIFQMLSRGTYTHRQVAENIGCPIQAVTRVAETRAREIEVNHRNYLKMQRAYKVVLASPSITGYPARPSSCVRMFIRNVSIFSRTFRRSGRMYSETREDWC